MRGGSRSAASGGNPGTTQKQGEIAAGRDIVPEAEPGPPYRHAGVRYHVGVEPIEDSMRTQRRDDHPQVEFEAQSRDEKEEQDDERFDAERPHAAAHDGEQGVVRGDDDSQGGVERPVAVKARERGEHADGQRQTSAHRVWHPFLLRVLRQGIVSGPEGRRNFRSVSRNTLSG
jgi:hypothetical protein